MVRNMVQKKKQEANRPCKKVFNQSIDSRMRVNRFPGPGRLNTSSHRVKKELKAKCYSPNFVVLPIFGPSRYRNLSDQFEKREGSRREKQASKSGQVEVYLPSSCWTTSSELATFFSSLMASLATQLFPAMTKYHCCSEIFPTRRPRNENQETKRFLHLWQLLDWPQQLPSNAVFAPLCEPRRPDNNRPL